MKVANNQRFNSTSTAATEKGLNTLELDTVNGINGQGSERSLWGPNCIGVLSIPGNGTRRVVPCQLGTASLAMRNGNVAADFAPKFGANMPELVAGCAANHEGVLGHARLGGNIFRHNVKADFATARRGAVRALQATAWKPSKGPTGRPDDTRLIDVESYDYCGHTAQTWFNPRFGVPISPRVEYHCNQEAAYRVPLPIDAARQKLDTENQTGGDGRMQPLAGKARVVFGTNVQEKISGVHNFPLGAALTVRGEQTFRLDVNLTAKDSFAGVQGLQSCRYFTQAEKKSPGNARLIFSDENRDSWQQYIITCLGARFLRRATVTDNHEESYNYHTTPQSLAHLANAEAASHSQPMSAMQFAAALKSFETPLGIGPEHVRRMGCVRGQEAVVEYNIGWRLQPLPMRPSYWTVWWRETKYTNRREFDLSHEPGRPTFIERVFDTKRVSIEKFFRQPTSRDVTAIEEWICDRDGASTELHKLRLKAEWYARSPQSPEQLNQVIGYYNGLFGIASPLLKTRPGAPKATRRIRMDTSLSVGDIDTLAHNLLEIKAVEEFRQRVRLPSRCVAQLQDAFCAHAATKPRTQALRQFIMHSGVRGMAFVHRFAAQAPAQLKVDADEEIFANASVHCAEILLRYQKPLDSVEDMAAVENRLYDVANALRLVQHARQNIEQDTVMPADRREAHLSHLKQQEKLLRNLCTVDTDASLRNSLYEKLIDRHFPTLQDLEFAALFHRVSGVHGPSTDRIVDRNSADLYLRHFENTHQILKNAEIGTINNILLSEQQRARHLQQIRAAVVLLQKDFMARRADPKRDKDRLYLLRPYQICGILWFLTVRGWRLFWLTFNGNTLREQLNFWSRDTLLTLAS